jgi:hypothetical protein
MKKNKALIGSALALLIAPTVLSNLSPQTVSAADTTEIGLVGTVSGSGVLVMIKDKLSQVLFFQIIVHGN